MTTTSATKQRSPWAIYIFGALAELLFGYDTGIIGVAMLSIHSEFELSPAEQGFVVSSLLLGAAIGVGTAGRLADRIGRRPVILLTSVVFAVGGVVAALAPTVLVLVLARFVMGLGVGASAVVVSVYLVEVAPTKHRGKIGSMGQLMVVLGVLIAYLVGYALQPSGAWRWMMGLSVVPAVVLALGLLFMPETPRWLVSQGRSAAARLALARLGRGPHIESELAGLVAAADVDARTSRGITSVLREMLSPAVRAKTIAAIGLAVLVQFVGTNSILYFAPTTLVHAGFGETAAVTANLSVGVANVLFTVLGMVLVDRVPRRLLLTIGTCGMIVGMVGLSIYTGLQPEPSTTGAYVTLIGMIVFLSSFAFSWGVCVRVVISELFPSAIRGTAAGLVLVLNWLANFVVGQTFPSLLALSSTLSFGLFAAVGMVAIVFIRRVLPETGAGRSLEDVETGVVTTR